MAFPVDGAPGVVDSELYDPASGLTKKPRTFTHMFTGTFTALGYTDLWAPAKRFHLMGYQYYISETATWTTAPFYISLRDNATSIDLVHNVPVATSLTYPIQETVILPGNGYRSIVYGNKLRVYLSIALNTGYVQVRVWGYEE